jgi:hypothetical protein
MRDVGTVNVLPTLEAILFELRSTAQVKQIIGDALVKSSEGPAVVAEAVIYVDNSLLLSASDLVRHLNCQHLTALDIAVANGSLAKPKVWEDPLAQILWQRGARRAGLHRSSEIKRLRGDCH